MMLHLLRFLHLQQLVAVFLSPNSCTYSSYYMGLIMYVDLARYSYKGKIAHDTALISVGETTIHSFSKLWDQTTSTLNSASRCIVTHTPVFVLVGCPLLSAFHVCVKALPLRRDLRETQGGGEFFRALMPFSTPNRNKECQPFNLLWQTQRVHNG